MNRIIEISAIIISDLMSVFIATFQVLDLFENCAELENSVLSLFVVMISVCVTAITVKKNKKRSSPVKMILLLLPTLYTVGCSCSYLLSGYHILLNRDNCFVQICRIILVCAQSIIPAAIVCVTRYKRKIQKEQGTGSPAPKPGTPGAAHNNYLLPHMV